MTGSAGAPPVVLVVLGTATEVGKTWFATRLLNELAALGLVVSARKPVQSFGPDEVGHTDADLLASATGELADQVCAPSRWYPAPMSPPMAADLLGRGRIDVDALLDELTWPSRVDVGLIETVGGVRSPLSHDTDSAGLAHLLHPTHAVIVADAGLGAVNAVRLATSTLLGLDVLVFLNRFDATSDLHRRNRDWLTTRDGYTVATDLAGATAWLAPSLP